MKAEIKEFLSRAEALCSRREMCFSDMQRKFREWKVPESEHQLILDELVKEKFIDELRYTQAFVNDKIKLGRWGKLKIKAALNQLHIANSTINEAFDNFPDEEYFAMLEGEIQKKWKSLPKGDAWKNKSALYRFGMSRGYEPDLISRAMRSLNLSDQYAEPN